jgi:hypothetical protein
MPSGLEPEDVLPHFVSSRPGSFQANTLLVRRQAVLDAGGFDADLRITQDAIFTLKLAIVARLVGGELSKPVAMARVHGMNRVTGKKRTIRDSQHWRFLGWVHLWRWGREPMTARHKRMWIDYFIRFINGDVTRRGIAQKLMYYWRSRYHVARLFFAVPDVARYPAYWRLFLPRLDGVFHYSRLLLDKLRPHPAGNQP